MVSIEEVVVDDDEATQQQQQRPQPQPSEERSLDADEIEALLPGLTRPTAAMRIESLVKQIRREASALERVEAVDEPSAATAKAAASPPPPQAPSPSPSHAPPKPLPSPSASSSLSSSSLRYTCIDRFAFDAGGSGDDFVTLYLPLPGVGSLRSTPGAVSSSFTTNGFDVTVVGLESDEGGGDGTKKTKNYRLKRDDLEHPIVPESSRHVVKRDKVVVKLKKKTAEHGGYDYWSKLTDPKKAGKNRSKNTTRGGKSTGDDPSAGLMDMMKDLYDSGDDSMRKMIGETMLKQRNGELNPTDPLGGGGGL